MILDQTARVRGRFGRARRFDARARLEKAIPGYHPVPMNDVEKIIVLLESDSIEKRIAAAIVLGELHVKKAQEGLLALMDSEVPVLRRHALEALTKIGMPRKVAPRLFALLSAQVADVRDAARAAITSFGEEIVPAIRERLPQALPDERRALDAILAELGGKDAFSTLLDGLASTDAEASKQAAIAMRQHVKSAGARDRKSYLAETEKFLVKQSKSNAPPNVIAGAIKIMGYLEDEKALGTLVDYAADAKQPPPVRQEALIALRFTLAHGAESARGGARSSFGENEKKIFSALLEAAEAPDRTLAQTALHTLGSLTLPAGMAKRVEGLASHPDFERARFAIEMLGRQSDPEATRVLVHAVCALERKRAEIAATALGGREDALTPLTKALLETKDADRAWILRNVLRPSAKKIASALRKQLLDEAMDRLSEGARGWEALLDVVRDADADGVAVAIRALAQKLRKAKNDDKAAAVYGLLCRSDRATDEDRYALASLELARGPKDTRPATRHADESLKMLASLLAKGFDVGSALRKDRSLELDALYYVGFHFVEAKKPLGEELLDEVVKKGGRTKVGKMAKNKLSLLQESERTSGSSAEAD
jgi:HEAT repeat protein